MPEPTNERMLAFLRRLNAEPEEVTGAIAIFNLVTLLGRYAPDPVKGEVRKWTQTFALTQMREYNITVDAFLAAAADQLLTFAGVT